MSTDHTSDPSVSAGLTGPSLEPTFETEMARLGKVLRALRGERYSLEALAQRSGVSSGLLSQIERGIGNPSYQTLIRVTNALGVTLADLVDQNWMGATDEKYIVRADQRRRLAVPAEGMAFDILTPAGQRELSMSRVRMEPHNRSTSYFTSEIPNETACIVAVTGTLALLIEGVEQHLHPGDTLTCPTSSIDAMGNDGDLPCEYVIVLTPGSL